MKTLVVLCLIFFSAVWALPKFQDPIPLKRHISSVPLKALQDITPKIINGTEAVPHSIPYQVILLLISEDVVGWTCAGTLISSTHVLTSAHCLFNAVEVIAFFGIHTFDDATYGSVYRISENLISHEGYTPEAIINDIGVIVLDQPVELNENISLATLPPRGTTTDYAGQIARISGWGYADVGGGGSGILREANVWVISSAACRLYFNGIEDSHICSIGGEGQRFCDGDNGGPLVVDDTQIGIISFAVRGCPADYPYGYTRITSYLDWLEKITGLTF